MTILVFIQVLFDGLRSKMAGSGGQGAVSSNCTLLLAPCYRPPFYYW